MNRRRNRHADLALTLSFELQKYLMGHPGFAKRIPSAATIIFELEGHSSFNRWAREIALRQAGPTRPLVTIRVRAMTPPVSRIKSLELVC